MFSRPYPSLVRGNLNAYRYDWDPYQLEMTLSTSGTELEVQVSVTESEERGYAGHWAVLSVRGPEGLIVAERAAGPCAVESPTPSWWVERGRVEESKLVRIKLGPAWRGVAKVIVGMERALPGTT